MKQQSLQVWPYPLDCLLAFQQSLLIDFASACDDQTYSSTTEEETWFGLGEFIGGILFDLYPSN